MKVTTLGIDLSKNIFHVHGADKRGAAVFSQALRRARFPEFMAKLPPCLIGMEACGGSHYWARELKKMGHDVRIMAAKFIKPYIKSNKSDKNDAEGICEAVQRPGMRFVPQKSVYQQDIQSLHRIRRRQVRRRTALVNEIRGLLGEYGIVLPRSIQNVRGRLMPVIESEEGMEKLSPRARDFFRELYSELVELDKRIDGFDKRIGAVFQASEACQRLAKVEGVGLLTATAFVSACGENAGVFKNGRECAAWLGLVPRQSSSGGKVRLLGISKRGDCYLRSLLIHGARAALRPALRKKDPRSRWAAGVEKRRGHNKAVVALANKNARVMWSLLRFEKSYKSGRILKSGS